MVPAIAVSISTALMATAGTKKNDFILEFVSGF
jgi:hypothetical protein